MNINLQLFSFFILTAVTSFPSFAGWEVQWIDRFDGDGINWNNWTAQTEANYNNEVQCYTDDESSGVRNYEVSDGTLKIIARKHNQPTFCSTVGENKTWTSGRLNSKDKQEFLYGRIESRIRFHNLEGGTWPAFWMLENRIDEQPKSGDDDFARWPNPGAGEIDVWEWSSNAPDSYITNFFNTSGDCGTKINYRYPNGGQDVLDWHTYAIEWSEDVVDFFIDDVKFSSQDVSGCHQYKEKMFVLLNLAMGGNLGGNIDPTLTLATFEIDYIAHCKESASSVDSYCNEDTVTNYNSTDTDLSPSIDNAYIAYSGEEDTFSMAYWGDTWGSGTSTKQTSDTYEMEFELTPGVVWGGASWAVIAWGNDPENSIDISDYTVAKFKVKSGAYESVKVSVQNGIEAEKVETAYQLDSAEDLGNGWVEVSASLPRFKGMTWFGLMFEGTTEVQVADVYFAGNSVVDSRDVDNASPEDDADNAVPDEGVELVPSPESGGAVNPLLFFVLLLVVLRHRK